MGCHLCLSSDASIVSLSFQKRECYLSVVDDLSAWTPEGGPCDAIQWLIESEGGC